ncbi:ADP-ribosyl-[dinitrogen reductase] hydrolase [Bacillus sp. SLBN-46]|uniref:ADP-ribosylglycohydrolase family protein n=1 Tax=Bacillus sp. SLBN-46 TaxID=3042283 RepID=UPI00285A051B|nr:ADP-ribosylglycohydrolase family protein [Bacillus sp. SLBN-46]MDR6121435.1 ADP-ribosyl-[dinitrogen reductase] hydrolase [Bacillus sp. SLBN-46]
MLDQIKGALFGFAIGDALGGTTEFLNKEEIEHKYGRVTDIIGGGVWDLEKGETTDDTAMTICVARGILKNPQNPVEAIGEEFIKWYDSRPKDIGIIIRTVLGLYDGNWFETAKKAHYQSLNKMTAGNGSLMRCLPVALAYQDIEEVEAITRNQSKMTHYDGKADEACVIYNRIAWHVLRGKAIKVAIKEEIEGTIYESALSGEKPSCHPSGYVVDTMRWVLYCLLTSESFSDVVIGAANEGHDSDTIAAIAGGLAGLSCGYKMLPREYCEVLLVKAELEELAIKLT